MAYEREVRLPPAVGGWLLFLCVALTFLFPASTLYSIIGSLRSGIDVAGQVYAFICLGLAGFSFAAGASLWLVLPNAVTIAKLFLIVRVTFAVALYGQVLLRRSTVSQDRLVALMVEILIMPVLFAVVWYSYLTMSTRVRATYPQDYSVVTKNL